MTDKSDVVGKSIIQKQILKEVLNWTWKKRNLKTMHFLDMGDNGHARNHCRELRIYVVDLTIILAIIFLLV